MTHDEAKRRVKEIGEIAGDSERAHAFEDELYLDFIKYVAAGQSEYRAVAAEILRTQKIAFSRWCA